MTLLGIVASSKLGVRTEPVAGYNLWLDASDATTFTFSSGTLVSQWSDKSANAYTFTQATVANQPSRSTTQNSKSTVLYDGTNDFLASTATASTWNFLHNGDGATVFIVCKVTGLGDHYAMITSDASTASVGWGAVQTAGVFASETLRGVGGTAIGASVTAATSTWFVFSMLNDQDNATVADKAKIWKDDGAANNNTSNYNASNNNCHRTLEIGFSGASGPYRMKGEIAEIITYTSLLSETDRQANVDYLQAKWGL
jgi:hypothetical protein